MLEAAVLEKMTDEVVDMEPLHDHDDGILGLVVEAGQQRVGGPLPKIVAGDLGRASWGFRGSSMMRRLPPRPVRVPPTDSANLKPRLVVATSSLLRWDESGCLGKPGCRGVIA